MTFSRIWQAAAIVAACISLSACGAADGGAEGQGTGAEAGAAGAGGGAPLPIPAGYPADYAAMIEQAKKEDGLLIYSNVAEYNWRDILAGFKQRYPWAKVATLDMGPSETFERYYSETSANQHTADLIVSGAPDAWQRFNDRKGIAVYKSPEAGALPEWSKPFPGLYTFSTDPMITIYNKMLLKENEIPTGMAQLANMTSSNAARFNNKLSTYDAASHSFAYAIHWSVVNQQKPGGWPLMAKLGPLTQPETGGAVMLDKVTAGEYLIAYYTSGITVFPKLNDNGRSRIVGWNLPADGTPVFLRGVAVTQAAGSPNTARLMLDYLLSKEGQIASGKGGMTPYRSDITTKDVPYLTYGEIERRIGAENIVKVGYEKAMVSDHEQFLQRWNALFKNGQNR